MQLINEGMGWVQTVLYAASMGTRIVALGDAVMRPAEAYVAAGKLTKPAWVLILAVSVGVGLVFSGLVGILPLAALAAAIFYLVDVRPALKAVSPPRRNRGGAAPPSDRW